MSGDSTPAVVYKPVPGFPGYRVGDDGTPQTCWKRKGGNDPKERGKFILSDTWKPLAVTPINSGYLMVRMFRGGKQQSMLLQHVVLLAFVGPCPAGMEACHDPDPTRTNCRADNLRWDTRKNNCADTIKHGRTTRGEKNKHAKITATEVSEIRKRAASGESQRSIARDFHLTQQTISDIVRRRSWAHRP